MDPKLALLVQLLALFSSWRRSKSKKMSSSAEKLLPLTYPNVSKWISISSPLSRKNTITFCNIWDHFTTKHGGVTSQRGRIKFNKYYFIHTIPGQLPAKKLFLQLFSSFAAIYNKGHFRKILTQISKLSWFSWYHSYIF